MATLLYGERPQADIEPGHRADTARVADTLDDMVGKPMQTFAPSPSFVAPPVAAPVAAPVHAEPPPASGTLAMAQTVPMAAAVAGVAPSSMRNAAESAPVAATPPVSLVPPMRPTYPTPSPWARPFALRGLVVGLIAAAVLFAGLAIFGIALAWSYSMTTFAQVALMVLGGYLISAGVAYIASVDTKAAAHA